jgi:hypothetical protein
LRARTTPIAVIALVLALAACGGKSGAAPPSKQPAVSNATTATTVEAALKRSVRTALSGNVQLAIYVLWNNRLPSWAERSTGGPALASLRSAAAGRRARGVRVRMITHSRRIDQIKLDPSYTTATVLLVDRQRVQPAHANGQPYGKPVVLNERASYQLHRVGKGTRFVVWRVKLLP